VTKLCELKVVNEDTAWSYTYESSWTKGNLHAVHDTTHVYSLPYERGKSYRVLQGYHGKFSHHGDDAYAVDFRMGEGSTICAARGGMVVDVKEDSKRGGTLEEYSSDANYVIIRHDDGTHGEYYHLTYSGSLVSIGQRVEAGTPIGLSGNTGYSTNPHLHFGVYSAVDGKRRQSHPLLFRTAGGIVVDLTEGRSYTVP